MSIKINKLFTNSQSKIEKIQNLVCNCNLNYLEISFYYFRVYLIIHNDHVLQF